MYILLIISFVPLLAKKDISSKTEKVTGGKHKVAVTVIDESGYPIEGAIVRMEGSDNSDTTNSMGIVKVDSNNLNADFRIQHKNYKPFFLPLSGLTATLTKK